MKQRYGLMIVVVAIIGIASAIAVPRRQHVTGAIPPAGACHARGVLPDPVCTPGRIDAEASRAIVCTRGYTARIRPAVRETNAVKPEFMAAYGVTGPNELDHLVPLELGGSSDARNLWPEVGTVPNLKDHVETALHTMVCRTRNPLALASAQTLIVADWTTALDTARILAP